MESKSFVNKGKGLLQWFLSQREAGIFLIILVIIISQIGRLVNTGDSNKRLVIPDTPSNKFAHTSDIKQEKTGEKNEP